VVFVGLVSIGHRNPLILHGGDTLLRIIAFYLILAPAGAALSVDRLIGLARGTAPAQPPLAPPWAQRLLQLQVAFVYAMTVLLKLKGGAWVDGTALYYTSRLEEFHRFPMPFVADSMLLVNLLTYWTLATELSLAFLIWVPGLRKFVLINGVLLHLGIEYSMNVPLFAFTMIIAYITFVDVEGAWQWVLAQQPLRRLPRATLWVPAGCRPCAAAARVLLALDLFRRLEPAWEPAPAGRGRRGGHSAAQLRVETADGRDRSGFAAYRWLAARLPLLWPLAPLCALPGARRLYAWADRFGHRAGTAAGPTSPTVTVNGPLTLSVVNGRAAAPPASEDAAGRGPCTGVAAFLAEQCVVSRTAITSAEALFDAYTRWARGCGERLISQREFGLALTEQGLTRRRLGKANRWHWAGVRLATAADRQAAAPTEANRSERDQTHPLVLGDAIDQAPLVGSPGFAVARQAGG
ncbi:MAG: HTTM domain-containing protein, partial [Geminicoccaceae bacterium]